MIQDSRIRQSEIFEKIVNRDGKAFRIRFVILERGGRLRGKVISCEAIEALSGDIATEEEKCLPVFAAKQSTPTTRVDFREIVSPFSTLEFFMSQMTRAPAGAI